MQNLNFIHNLQEKKATLSLHFITAIYQSMRLTLVLACSAFAIISISLPDQII